MRCGRLRGDVARRFGSSGIRGPFAPETVDLAFRLGQGTAQLAGRILVGHDVRTTGPLLAAALASGALSSGAEVTLAGPAATPTLAFGARDRDVAVAITASHNPPPDNGFKFWNPDGAAWGPDQESAIETLLDATAARSRPEWKRLRARTMDDGLTLRHRDAIIRFVGPLGSRVVLDCGNGAGAYVSPTLLRGAGADVDVLFGEPDGRFPNRPSEPAPEHLAALRAETQRRGAWGIAHDGDADRMVAVAPDGSVAAPDLVLTTLALHRRARRLVVPIDASLALRDALPEASFTLCRVGDAAVSATLRSEQGDLGGETSGTYVVPAFNYAPDGPLAAALFLKAVEAGAYDEARSRLRSTVRRSAKLPMGALDRETLGSRLQELPCLAGERATRTDGVRLDGEDGWVLIRPSGTEPILRVSSEGWDAPTAEEWLRRGLSAAQRLLA